MKEFLQNEYHIAVPTAFHEDEELNTASTLEHMNNLKMKGIGSVLVCGSTGEQHSLTLSEKLALLEAIEGDQRFDEGVEIIFGVSSIRQKEAVALVKRIHSCSKIAGILLGFPPYILPTQDEAEVYVNAIAGEYEKSIVLYNNPKRTGFDLSLSTLSKIMKHENVVGLKEAGDITRIPTIKSNIDKPFCIYAGGEIALKEKIQYGCDRLSSIVGNIYPLEIKEWFESLLDNTQQPVSTKIDLENEINKIFNTSTLSYLKSEISKIEQLDMGMPRSPLGNL